LRLKGSSEIINDVPGVSTVAGDTSGTIKGVVEELRKNKILPAGNITDPERGIFECETGQIKLDTGKKCLIVKGRNIAGACFEKLDSPLEVDNILIESASVSASVTIASIDDKPITEASRILLVVATDARNSNETYNASDHAVINRLGTLPVLVRTGRFSIALRRALNSPALKAWALALDGTRTEPLAVRLTQGWLKIDLNTSILSKGPTPFIELAS
jgi:hypothetical protein